MNVTSFCCLVALTRVPMWLVDLLQRALVERGERLAAGVARDRPERLRDRAAPGSVPTPWPSACEVEHAVRRPERDRVDGHAGALRGGDRPWRDRCPAVFEPSESSRMARPLRGASRVVAGVTPSSPSERSMASPMAVPPPAWMPAIALSAAALSRLGALDGVGAVGERDDADREAGREVLDEARAPPASRR